MAFSIIVWLCACIFAGIGIYARMRKSPMHFWSGSTVAPEEIRDIPAYNRANAHMWFCYAGVFFLCGAAGVWDVLCGALLVAAASVGGIPVLAAVYRRIYEKYRA
nr:hypothetical protein [Maliibacterium massiliense]